MSAATDLLVWHQGALGDLMLSLPSLHSIKKYYHGRRMHVIAKPELSALLLKGGVADDFSSNEAALFADLFAAGERISPALRQFLSPFFHGFIFLNRPDPFFRENLVRSVRHPLFIATSPPEGMQMHVSDYQLQGLRTCGIESRFPFPLLNSDIRPSSDLKMLTIHPGSGSAKKCWPLERYQELLSLLVPYDYRFTFILGPAERDRYYGKVMAFASSEKADVRVVMDRPLPEIADCLRRSSLYIGNDSGVTHLAAALGTPTVAIFGPTDFRIWGPKDSLTVSSPLPCSPCSGESQRSCADQRCLREIRAETVMVPLAGSFGLKTNSFPS